MNGSASSTVNPGMAEADNNPLILVIQKGFNYF